MQAQRGCAMAQRMIRSLPVALLLAATSSLAMAQGPIDTVLRGRYVCEMPGNAAVGASVPLPERHFTIESSSRYCAPQAETRRTIACSPVSQWAKKKQPTSVSEGARAVAAVSQSASAGALAAANAVRQA